MYRKIKGKKVYLSIVESLYQNRCCVAATLAQMEEEVLRNRQSKVEVEVVGRQCLQLWDLRRGHEIGGQQLYLRQLRMIQEVDVGRDKSSRKQEHGLD